jgi:hypothetical protein
MEQKANQLAGMLFDKHFMGRGQMIKFLKIEEIRAELTKEIQNAALRGEVNFDDFVDRVARLVFLGHSVEGIYEDEEDHFSDWKKPIRKQLKRYLSILVGDDAQLPKLESSAIPVNIKGNGKRKADDDEPADSSPSPQKKAATAKPKKEHQQTKPKDTQKRRLDCVRQAHGRNCWSSSSVLR